MNARKVVGIVLVAIGILALVYKSFSVPTERSEAKVGPLEFSVQKKETYSVPTWLGVVAIVAGGALLVVPGKR